MNERSHDYVRANRLTKCDRKITNYSHVRNIIRSLALSVVFEKIMKTLNFEFLKSE